MKATAKPPFSKETFENRTALLIEVIAETCLEKRGVNIHENNEQVRYFITLADLWVRYLYANDKTWRSKIDSKRDNQSRDWCYMFVGHWADAFVKDRDWFIAHHPLDALGQSKVQNQP